MTTARLRVLYFAKTSVGAPWAVRQVRDHVRLGIDAHVAVPAGGPAWHSMQRSVPPSMPHLRTCR